MKSRSPARMQFDQSPGPASATSGMVTLFLGMAAALWVKRVVQPGHLAPLIARHTFAGVSGMSRLLAPTGRIASCTAATSTGIDAVQPDSPTPLTPSGLSLLGVG